MAIAEMNYFQNSENKRAESLIPWGSLLLTVFVLFIYVLPETTLLMQFDRIQINEGQIWRILTGHFTHWSTNHLFWDLLVFVILGVICERINRKSYLVCLVLSTVCISLGVFIFLPEMELYRGLSGIDSALFVLLMVEILKRKYKEKSYIWIFVILFGFFCFISKLLFEIFSGETIFVESSGVMIPVPLAHLIGGIVGILSNIFKLNRIEQIYLWIYNI